MRQNQAPSHLLMPLAFAGSAGSLLLLTGSPVNLIISEAAANAGVGGFRYAEFALVGVPLVLGTIVTVLLLGPRLLPTRTSRTQPPDLSKHARTLVQRYGFDRGVFRLRIRPRSPLAGQPRAAPALQDYPGLTVVSVLAGGAGRPVDEGTMAVDDVLVVSGDPETVSRAALEQWLAVEDTRSAEDVTHSLLTRDLGAAEVIIPPRSRLIGETIRPGTVLSGGDLVVLAVQRQGRDRGQTDTALAVGDALLVEGTWEALEQNAASPQFLVVDSPELLRRQAVPMGRRSGRAIAVLVAMVVLLASGVIPAFLAALLAGGAMIVLRVLNIEQAYRGVSWTTVILVGGIIPLSTAIRVSGAGEAVAHVLVQAVGGAGPYALLVALFLLTAVFGQLISNTATALIMIPIAVSAASQLHVSARPVLISLCVACAASFLTPVATPANMMIMGPAGYRFGDYWKLGLAMVALFFVVAVLLVPLIWPF
jgi:di/tricarboxylate transporter